jgi:hypothetical protein
MDVLSKLRKVFFPKRSAERSIEYDVDGFTVHFDGVPNVTVRWAGVREIVALKQDHFSCDSI